VKAKLSADFLAPRGTCSIIMLVQCTNINLKSKLTSSDLGSVVTGVCNGFLNCCNSLTLQPAGFYHFKSICRPIFDCIFDKPHRSIHHLRIINEQIPRLNQANISNIINKFMHLLLNPPKMNNTIGRNWLYKQPYCHH